MGATRSTPRWPRRYRRATPRGRSQSSWAHPTPIRSGCHARTTSDRCESARPMSTTTELDHEKTFAAAWANPRYTRTERPPVDVNAVLAKHYRLSRPLTFTRTQLWDMEVRKAFRPDIYISAVVEE